MQLLREVDVRLADIRARMEDNRNRRETVHSTEQLHELMRRQSRLEDEEAAAFAENRRLLALFERHYTPGQCAGWCWLIGIARTARDPNLNPDGCVTS